MPDNEMPDSGVPTFDFSDVSLPGPGSDFPTGRYIEIGSGSSASFAAESHGVNSGAHNKSADELLSVFEEHKDAILRAATSDIRQHFQSMPS